MIPCLQQIHHERYAGLHPQDSRLGRLAHIDFKIPDFLTNREVDSERNWLIRSMMEERMARAVKSILRPSQPNSKVKNIESIQEKLSRLIGRLKENAHAREAKSAFHELPDCVRDLFYWAIWVHHSCPHEDKFGEERLKRQMSLLCDIQYPLLFLKGTMLCEQMFHLYEMIDVLEKQKNNVELLKKISEKIYSPLNPLNEVRSLLRQLPPPMRRRFHQEVYTFSPHRRDEPQWGEKELERNSQCLIRLRNSSGTNLLEQCLQEQIGELHCLEKMGKIEEFDRLTLLFKIVNPTQWQAVISHASEDVREWIGVVEATARRKEKLNSDPRHLYQWRGAHPKVDGTQFQVFAPNARQVKLILTAFGKEEHCISMHKDCFGIFETYSYEANPGRTYRFLIEDCFGHWNYRTDPFSFSLKDQGDVVESVVSEIETFAWKDQQWMQHRLSTPVCQRPLSIYEIHADSWKKRDGHPLSFRELAYAIVEYQQKLFFTHIQIYGVLDHKNDYSWGYQTDHFFAPNRRLGSAEDFMFLVDLCHQRGIGVIIDWIPTHYKPEHGGDRSQSLYEYDGTDLFGRERSAWGTTFFDFNKEETKRFLRASALYWFEKMHVDGLRVDAVSPMICRHNENQWAAINFLKELNAIVHEHYPNVLMIAEETDGFPKVTKPIDEGGLGFDSKIGVHLEWQIRNYFRTPYDQRGWGEHHFGKILSNLNEIEGSERWLIAHTHDDAASGEPHRHSTIYGSIPTMDTWKKFADMRLILAWNLLSPGYGHGIHMGDEIGQRWPWNERLQAHEGSVEWHLLEGSYPESSFHRGLQECAGDLNRFYRSRQAFWKEGGQRFQLVSHSAQNRVIGMYRFGDEGQRLALFFNFSPDGYQEYDFPLTSYGMRGAREVFNTDGIQYGGTGQFRNSWARLKPDSEGNPSHFCFSFPPLSLVAFEETHG